MLDTLKIYNYFKEKLDPEVAEKLAETLGDIYAELSNSVTKSDFEDLKSVIKEIIEVQKDTGRKINELTEAQKRTEQRVEELAQAQKRTEQRLDSLTVKVEELAEAQKRTEQRVEELAIAQQNTNKAVKDLQKQVGGISNSLGYFLENRSYKHLKKILAERFGIKVNKLYRTNIVYAPDRFDEINIYGEGKQNGRTVVVIGESKTQFGPKDVQQFAKLVKRVKEHLKVDVFPLAIAHQFHPKAETRLKALNIPFFWSYEFEE